MNQSSENSQQNQKQSNWLIDNYENEEITTEKMNEQLTKQKIPKKDLRYLLIEVRQKLFQYQKEIVQNQKEYQQNLSDVKLHSIEIANKRNIESQKQESNYINLLKSYQCCQKQLEKMTEENLKLKENQILEIEMPQLPEIQVISEEPKKQIRKQFEELKKFLEQLQNNIKQKKNKQTNRNDQFETNAQEQKQTLQLIQTIVASIQNFGKSLKQFENNQPQIKKFIELIDRNEKMLQKLVEALQSAQLQYEDMENKYKEIKNEKEQLDEQQKESEKLIQNLIQKIENLEQDSIKQATKSEFRQKALLKYNENLKKYHSYFFEKVRTKLYEFSERLVRISLNNFSEQLKDVNHPIDLILQLDQLQQSPIPENLLKLKELLQNYQNKDLLKSQRDNFKTIYEFINSILEYERRLAKN